MRQVVLDTETTGLSVQDGHKIIEIGCVEIIHRKITSNNFHVYINPSRPIDKEAIAVHGITNEFLIDKPKFHEVKKEFIDFIGDAELIIHNARFDLSFLNYELQLIEKQFGLIEDKNSVIDTLQLARSMYPGQRNSLDALCKRLGVDNTNRKLHGALLDAEILASVYLEMTAGQIKMEFTNVKTSNSPERNKLNRTAINLTPPLVTLTQDEINQHLDYLKYMEETSKVKPIWLAMEQDAHA